MFSKNMIAINSKQPEGGADISQFKAIFSFRCLENISSFSWNIF